MQLHLSESFYSQLPAGLLAYISRDVTIICIPNFAHIIFTFKKLVVWFGVELSNFPACNSNFKSKLEICFNKFVHGKSASFCLKLSKLTLYDMWIW